MTIGCSAMRPTTMSRAKTHSATRTKMSAMNAILNDFLGEDMKPFDLTKAQAGEPILLMLSSEFDMTPVRLVGMLTDGRYVVERRAESDVYYVEVATEQRLRMAPNKKTVYVNFWRDVCGVLKCSPFDSEQEANTAPGYHPWIKVAAPIEIED